MVGSAFNAAYYIKNVVKLPANKKVFVIGEPGLEQELADAGINYIGGHQVEEGTFYYRVNIFVCFCDA